MDAKSLEEIINKQIAKTIKEMTGSKKHEGDNDDDVVIPKKDKKKSKKQELEKTSGDMTKFNPFMMVTRENISEFQDMKGKVLVNESGDAQLVVRQNLNGSNTLKSLGKVILVREQDKQELLANYSESKKKDKRIKELEMRLQKKQKN